MSLIKSFQRSMFLMFVLVVVAISYSFYLAISHIVVEQSRLQHQSIAPVFSLINEELMQPLHVSLTLAHSQRMKELMDTSEIDEPAMVDFLMSLEKNLGLSFFAASEKAHKQYYSDGRTLALTEGKVEWYFELKKSDNKFFAALGQKDDIHLYIDVKIYNDQGEFLGFVGIGKSLHQFWSKFKQHKSIFGYELMFVNNKHEIILSSDEGLLANKEKLVHLEDLSWYGQVKKQVTKQQSLDSSLIKIANEEFLISEIYIETLDWTLFLLSPLKGRKADITETFMVNVALLLILIVFLFIIGHYLIKYFADNIEETLHQDALTGLVNRHGVEQGYEKISHDDKAFSLIMVDIDHFKKINDSYGHNAGDLIIQNVSQLLQDSVRELDIVGRWGGEEFILLLPGANLSLAQAIAERMRIRLAAMKINHVEHQLSVTASFGVTFSQKSIDLKKVVAVADKALYQAKQQGRNKVCSLLGA